ncbi:AAA+ ATPase domain-containing protein, partial [Tanacetum coccineum]
RIAIDRLRESVNFSYAEMLHIEILANTFYIICANTMFGDAMRRGIAGGQKKRLTAGEMIVGPTKALFMDEISNGLENSTTYQIINWLQLLAHVMDASVLISILQPSPEPFDIFNDIMLMA